MKNIIFSDVDGTLYDRKHIIDPLTIKDIKRAQELDVEFIIATGNGFFTNMKEVATKLNVQYVITSNGASIYDMKANEYIRKSMVPASIINKILKYAKENKVATIFWDEDGVYVNQEVPQSTKDLIHGVMFKDGIIKVKNEVTKDIFKIEFYDTKEKIDEAMKFLETLDIQTARMKPGHVEITHKGVSKGHAVEFMCDKLNIDFSKTMGIGDSANDLTMFSVVNSSYAMDNAADLVKEKADYYTCDVTQNGLGYAIIDYLHREKLDRGR